MAKKKLNAFNDRNAKEITTEDVEGLLKMQKEAKDKANYEANKADYKAPKYNSLPTLDDTSKRVSTQAPSVSPETMKVGNKTFKVADGAKNTTIKKNNGSAQAITDDNASQLLSKTDRRYRDTKRATSKAERQAVNHPGLSTLESVALAPFAGVEGVTRSGLSLATGNKAFVPSDSRTNSFVTTQKNLREGAKKNIKSDAGKTVYDVGTDIADMIVDNLVSGGSSAVAGLLMGGLKAGEALKKSFERNNNTRQAGLYSALAGLAEGYFNTKGLDALKGAGKNLKGIAQASAVEGAENLLQSVTEDVADLIVNNKNSEMALAYNDMVKNGVSSDDAVKQIAVDALKQYGLDFTTGAGFGALMKGASAIGSKKLPALEKTDVETKEDAKKIEELAEALKTEKTPTDAKVEPEIQNGIQVYRGYNRSDNPLERNLAKEKTLSDVLGKKIPGTEEPEMLPLKYYTESFEDAESYANHDKLFYDSLRESAKREMAGDAINGKIKMNNMSEAAKEAYIKNIMDETYRILTGREPIFGNGHVDTLTINPNNVLDITTLGDRTNTENVYNLLSEMTGLPHTLPNGQYGADLDDYLSLSGLGDEFNTYMLLRNLGKGGNYGKNFTGLMRDYGYDAVKYSEDGYNHYALLDDFDKSKVGTNEQLIARYNERIQKILDDINRRDVKEPYKWEEETLNDLENRIDYLLENESHIDANTVDTKTIPNLEDAIVEDVTKANNMAEDDVANYQAERESLIDKMSNAKSTSESRDYAKQIWELDNDMMSRHPELFEEDVEANKSPRYMAEDAGIGNTARELDDFDEPIAEQSSPMDNTVEMPDGTLKTESGEFKERGYSDSIRNKTDLPEDVKNEFPEYYEVLKNKDTEASADKIMADNDVNGALAEAYKRIKEKDAVGIPLGYKVSKALIDAGRQDDAVALLKMMSEELTRSGQFSQAAAITLMHEDPMTALRYLQKQMDSINTEGRQKYKKKWHDLELTEDEIARLGELKQGDREGIENAFSDVYKRLQKEYPSTTWEKFVELTKLGMLLNPRTHIRNTVANGLLIPLRSASDRVSAIGQIMSGVDERTQSLVGGTKAQKKIAGEIYEREMKQLLEGDDKWSDLKGVAKDKQVFGDSKIGWLGGEALYRGLNATEKLGNAISEMPFVDKLTGGRLSDALTALAKDGKEGMTDSIIENLRRFDYYLLSKVEDDPFVKKNFVNRLASYMKAQNINSIDDIPMEAKQVAWQEALKATFKDDNRLTRMLAGFKKEAGKFGEVLFPFTKTPANLAMRAVDYSPVGILKAIKDYRDIPIDARSVPKLWDDMSKGMVGSAGILLGYLLRKSGVITGALSDDTDTANFEKQTGKQAYSLHLGDKYYSYDWAQPAGTPMIIGANIYDAINSEGNSENGKLGTIANGAKQGSKAAINTWLELSPLQSLGTLFNGSDRSKTFADRAIETVTDMPQRLIPSLMGATARTVDPTMRETYDRTSAVNTWVNTAKSKIPAIGDDDNWWNTNVSSKSLPAKYDNWGNERTRSDSIKEAAFAQMVNPGQLSNNNSTPIDNEIGRLGELDAKAYPSTAGWSVKVGDNNVTLSNEEHSEYQKNLGEAQYQLAEHFVNSDYYNKFSDDEKTEILGNLYSFANALAKSEQFDYDIAGNSNYKKAYAEYQKGGLGAVADYYATKNVLSDVSEQFTKKNGEGKSFSDLSKEENLKVLTDMVNDGYMTKEEAYDYLPDNKMVNTLSQYGNKGYELYADLVQYGTSNEGKFTNEKVIPVLRGTNTDPKIAGEVLHAMNSGGNSKRADQVYNELGPEGLWDYYNYKEYANLDGEGNISKDELVAYLNSRDMDRDEKYFWFDMLKSGSNVKNPY